MKTLLRNFLLALIFLASPAWALQESDKTHLFRLSYAQAEEAVSAALTDKGAAEKVAAFINGRMDDALYSYGKPITVAVRGLQFDKISGRWSANLLMVAEGEVVTAMPAGGRFDILAEIPMLKRNIKNGEVIETKDIEIRDIAQSQVRSDTVTDIASLIGKSPAHTISAARPIRVHEIEVPPVVRKNSVVRMRYTSPGMEISTSGQAMEDGSKGTLINVKNLASKKIVQAVVDDIASVSVTAPDDTRAETKPLLGDLYATN